MADRVGQQFGQYRLSRFLGRGSFGEVYLGEHVHKQTLAAVKVLQGRLTPEDLKEFINEANTTFRLQHPILCNCWNLGLVLVIHLSWQWPMLLMARCGSGIHGERGCLPMRW